MGKEILTYIRPTDLTGRYRTVHPKPAKYKFFSNEHGALSKTDHVKPQNKPQ